MNIRLSPEQQKWLEAQVAAGHFASIDQAVSVAVADLIAIGNDDLAWAKADVDQARESVARGNVVSGEDYLAGLKAKIDSLRNS